MPTTYLKSGFPTDGQLLEHGKTKGGGAFSSGFSSGFSTGTATIVGQACSNGRRAISGPMRVAEEAVRNIACRCHLSHGGHAKRASLTSTTIYPYELGLEGYAETAEFRIGISSTADCKVLILSDTDATGTEVSVTGVTDADDADSVQYLTIPVQVGDGSAAAPSIESVAIQFQWTSGTIYVWSVTIEPVPLPATTELSI
jgi:hypothetical protein